jgi:hypothetical protein
MEPWTGAQRAFAVKEFYKNGDSFVIAQREFRRQFRIHRNLRREYLGTLPTLCIAAAFSWVKICA